ncbi:MAG: carboxymuconolactone decarboxylase family protein [Solirubrobacterales bacterium]
MALANGDHATSDSLARAAAAEHDALADRFGLEGSDDALDGRGRALARLAALIALDAPPAAYAREVAAAGEAGATAEDVLGTLRAVADLVGSPKVVAAAPEIMLALGLNLPGDL